MCFVPGRGGARLTCPRVVVQAEGVVGGGGELHVELLHGRHGGAHHVPRPVEVVRVVEGELGGGGGGALHTTKLNTCIQTHILRSPLTLGWVWAWPEGGPMLLPYQSLAPQLPPLWGNICPACSKGRIRIRSVNG